MEFKFELKPINVKFIKLVTNKDNYESCGDIYVNIDDKVKILKLLYDELIDDMLNYSCDGCRYCCDSKTKYKYYKDICERKFKDKSELPEYVELIVDRSKNLEIELYSITFDKNINEYISGLQMQEELIWSLESAREEFLSGKMFE